MAKREYDLLIDYAHDEIKSLRDVPGCIDAVAESVAAGRLEAKDAAAVLLGVLAAARDEADDACRSIAIALASNGFSPQELADVLGVTRTTIFRWRREAAAKKADTAPQREELPLDESADS